MQVEIRIQGIPALAKVTYYNKVKPWKGCISNCPSDMDYYGYTEIEYEVLDRKGYKAAWLEKKMTKQDEENIKIKIQEEMGD
jgi:hypothetical protein